MHYIIGTEILIPEQRAMGNSGIQPVNSTQVQKKNKGIGPFQPGVHYRLYNIRVNRDTNKLQYTFECSHGEPLIVPFESVEEAEKYISAARGESLPRKDQVSINNDTRMI